MLMTEKVNRSNRAFDIFMPMNCGWNEFYRLIYRLCRGDQASLCIFFAERPSSPPPVTCFPADDHLDQGPCQKTFKSCRIHENLSGMEVCYGNSRSARVFKE